MTKCWEHEPRNRPSFKELQRSTSSCIEKIAGYLEMNFYYTGRKTTKEKEDREEEGKKDSTIPEQEKELFKCTLHP